MKPKFWGAIVFMLSVAVAATPASGSDLYVAAAVMKGDATYMALNPDGTFSDQEDLMLASDHDLSGFSYGNGIGDFDNDGDLDYVMALGNRGGDIYIFPRSGSGNQFDPPVWAGAWTEGIFPADMAVADFNGDGNLDFVLNYFMSPHCGLYLGDGTLGFVFTLLSDTTPVDSIGIDAADFNNDGIADFVIAPNSSKPFHVFLGNGDGTFEQVISDRTPSISKATGIAAGDFVNDPDGFADLAVSSRGFLEIYTGNGDGTFALLDTYEFPMNPSPLDNGDFDNDGHQDLVAADFGGAHAGVAILMGNGSGEFTHTATHLGANTGFRKAVTALPFLSNKAPVAQLTPETITVTVGEAVEWDASGSFDEDGTIVRYEWDYGDGAGVVAPLGTETPALAAFDAGGNLEGPQSSYVYYDSGTYVVTLKVTDNRGATATVEAEVQVDPMPVEVYFSPRRLNLKSRGKWVTATIRLPGGYDAGLIDRDSLYLVKPGQGSIKAQSAYKLRHYGKHYKKKYKYHRTRKLKVKFDRQALIASLAGSTGETTLTVIGDISTDSAKLEFSGTGTIKVYEKKKKSFFKKNYWQQVLRYFFKGGSKQCKYQRH